MASEDNQQKNVLNVATFSKADSQKVQNAVAELQGERGIALSELKKFMKNGPNQNEAAVDQTKLLLSKNLKRGVLSKDGGSYKIRETKLRRARSKSPAKGRKRSRSRRSRSKGRKSSKGRKRAASKGKKGGRRKKTTSRRKRRSRRTPAAAAQPM